MDVFTQVQQDLILPVLVAETVVAYMYWRMLRKQYPDSPFRAYDILFLTIVVALVLGRLSGVAANWEVYRRAGIGSLFEFWDLKFDYHLVAVVPLLVYQFVVLTIERKASWKKSSGWFVLFGVLFVLPVIVAQVFRSLLNGASADVLIFHLLQLVWGFFIGIMLFIYLARKPRPLAWLSIPMAVLLPFVGWLTADFLLRDVRPERQVITGVLVSALLLLAVIIPFLEVERKSARTPGRLNRPGTQSPR